MSQDAPKVIVLAEPAPAEDRKDKGTDSSLKILPLVLSSTGMPLTSIEKKNSSESLHSPPKITVTSPMEGHSSTETPKKKYVVTYCGKPNKYGKPCKRTEKICPYHGPQSSITTVSVASAPSSPTHDLDNKDDNDEDDGQEEGSDEKKKEKKQRGGNRGKSWEERYSELKEFYKVHGHCNVSQKDRKFWSVANWVAKQRQKRKHPGTAGAPLTEEQIKLLDELNFEWDRFPTNKKVPSKKRSEEMVLYEDKLYLPEKLSPFDSKQDILERPTEKRKATRESISDPNFFENQRKKLRKMDKLNGEQDDKNPPHVKEFLNEARIELERLNHKITYEREITMLKSKVHTLTEEAQHKDRTIATLQKIVMQRNHTLANNGVLTHFNNELLQNMSVIYKIFDLEHDLTRVLPLPEFQ